MSQSASIAAGNTQPFDLDSAAPPAPVPATVPEYLDSLPIGRPHVSIFAASALGFIFDAFELGILGLAGPSIAQEWGLRPSDLAILFSLTAAGMLIGSFLFGTASDYFGRRPSFQLTVLIFALGSGCSYFASDATQLGLCRLITGIGIGGFIPVDYAIMSEFMPARRRGQLMGLWALFLPVGALLTAQLAGLIIPALGWRALFLVGVLPALGALLARMFIPESPRFLMEKGRHAEARRSVLWMNGGHSLPAEVDTSLERPLSHPAHTKFSVTELFSPTYRMRTIFAWVVWFCQVFCYLGLTPWLPTLLTKFKGVPAADIYSFMTVYAAIGIVGRLAVSFTVDRIGRRPLLIFLAIGGTFSMFMLGQQTELSGLQIWGWTSSFFMEGLTGLLAALTPELFPTRARSTGIGWAQGIGRIGGIIAPLAIGAIVLTSIEAVFLLFAGAYAIVLVAGLLMRVETKGLSLEAASSEA